VSFRENDRPAILIGCTGQMRGFARTFGEAAPKVDSASDGFVHQVSPLSSTLVVKQLFPTKSKQFLTAKGDNIGFLNQKGLDFQTGIRICSADACQHKFKAFQRFASPINTDWTKQTMFNWVPLRRTGWIMAYYSHFKFLIDDSTR